MNNLLEMITFKLINNHGESIRIEKIDWWMYYPWTKDNYDPNKRVSIEKTQEATELSEIEQARIKYQDIYWKPVPIAFKNRIEWINSKLEIQ